MNCDKFGPNDLEKKTVATCYKLSKLRLTISTPRRHVIVCQPTRCGLHQMPASESMAGWVVGRKKKIGTLYFKGCEIYVANNEIIFNIQ